MAGRRMCPFLVVALGKGIQQVPVVSQEGVPPELACCREDCMWYAGGKCAMQALAERLTQIVLPSDMPVADVDTA